MEPIIVISNATKEMAVRIVREATEDVSDLGFSCRLRLNEGGKDQYVVTFPEGIVSAGAFFMVVQSMHVSSRDLNINGLNTEVRGFFDGDFLDGEVKPQGVVNIFYPSRLKVNASEFIIIDEAGNCYVDNPEEEDALFEKAQDEDAFILCVQPSSDVHEPYVNCPEHVNTHGIEGVKDFVVVAEVPEEDHKAMDRKETLSCFGSVVLYILSFAVVIQSIFLSAELRNSFNYLCIILGLQLVVTSVISLAKPVPHTKGNVFSRFYAGFEYYFIRLFVVSAYLVTIVLSLNKYAASESYQVQCKVLPQTPVQKDNLEISYQFPDGHISTCENAVKVRVLSSRKVCSYQYTKGFLGLDIKEGIVIPEK